MFLMVGPNSGAIHLHFGVSCACGRSQLLTMQGQELAQQGMTTPSCSQRKVTDISKYRYGFVHENEECHFLHRVHKD